MTTSDSSSYSDLKGKFSDEENDFSEISIKIPENINNNYSPINEEKSNKREKEKDKYNQENLEYGDLIKCYICLNPSKDPSICRHCGNIACKKCFSKWINTHYKCGCCRKNITKEDIISPPIIGKINEFLKNIKDKVEFDQCKQHKEKYLYYCVNCVRKYCGKCLFFGSEEAKKHIGHKIIDYEEIKKSKYNDLINELESANEIPNKIDNCSKIYDFYKIENKSNFENSNIALDAFKKHIFKKFDEKNNSIAKNIEDLNNIKNGINETCKFIYNNLKKLENPQKPIKNFNSFKYCEMLKNNKKEATNLENKIEMIHNKKNIIEFKTTNFQIVKSLEEITKRTGQILIIKDSIYVKINLENDSYFSINIPDTFKDKNGNKIIHVFPLVTFKNKIYNFKRNKLQDENNNLEEKIIKNNNFVTIININELDCGENIFYFLLYKFSIY